MVEKVFGMPNNMGNYDKQKRNNDEYYDDVHVY